MLKAGQNILLNNRLWSLRQVTVTGRNVTMEAIGASNASLGMTRRMTAIQLGNVLFIAQQRGGYWRANLENDWIQGDYGPVLHCQPASTLDLLAAHTLAPETGELKREFSWSYSRGAKYRACPRAYYYHYYAAWEGWQKDTSPPVQQAYRLKNLTHLPRYVGTVVHETLKYALARLKAGQPVALGALLSQLSRRVQSDFNASEQQQRKKNKPDPGKIIQLQEHYYGQALPKDYRQTALHEAEQHVRTFMASALYAHFCHRPATEFLDVETLQSFPVAGVKVWVQMDLARREDGTLFLYDWKSGKVDEAEVKQQLGVYGLYTRYAWPEQNQAPIRGIVYALAEDRVVEFDLNAATLQAAQTRIEADIDHLQGLLINPQASLAEMRRFPMIDNLEICHSCQFRELCGR